MVSKCNHAISDVFHGKYFVLLDSAVHIVALTRMSKFLLQQYHHYKCSNHFANGILLKISGSVYFFLNGYF